MDWNLKLKQLMGQATQLVRSGHLAEATRTIQQALGGAPAPAHAPERATAAAGSQGTTPVQAPTSAAPRASFRSASPWPGGAASEVQDAVVIERGKHPGEPETDARPQGAPSHEGGGADPVTAPGSMPLAEAPGSFTRVAFSHPGAPHNPHHYHVFVPPGASAAAPMPLVLMLHGCTQNPLDFATGTGMNAAAAPANAMVLYPEQPHSANPHGCWNWFRPGDQRRDSGEPALLVAMVRDVMARHSVDPRRVYVAGLSAGGAMAALLGREYPDVFAAVGVHSGLQAGAAHNVMAALSAMKNGAKSNPRGTPVAAPGQPVVPVIVFHGDADGTVHARNGEQVIHAALGAVVGGAAAVQSAVETGRSAAGRGFTRTVYRRATSGMADNSAIGGPATVVAEHWVLHGASHAWAGGSAQGSHTDPQGVNATAEMLRFFLEHGRTSAA